MKIIRKFFRDLPTCVDYQTREPAEADLARVASGLKPEELRQVAGRLMMLVNPDATFSDAERARRRHLTIGKQDADGMSQFNGLLDPEARATLDAVFAKLAAPGMCNPDDETPCVDGEPGEDTARRDVRSQGQRNHDALNAGYKKWHTWERVRKIQCGGRVRAVLCARGRARFGQLARLRTNYPDNRLAITNQEGREGSHDRYG